MDEYTKKHLDKWIENHFYEEDQEEARAKIIALVNDDPDLIPSNHSWPEILSMAERQNLTWTNTLNTYTWSNGQPSGTQKTAF